MEQARKIPLAAETTADQPTLAIASFPGHDPDGQGRPTDNTGAGIAPAMDTPEDGVADDFLFGAELASWAVAHAGQSLAAAISEAEELIRQCRWQDIVALFHPVEEKMPELAATGMDLDLRQKVAFALGQIGRHEEAIAVLEKVVAGRPDDFLAHSSLAYTLVQSLRDAKNRKVLLIRSERERRVKLAHHHFSRCRRLRPNSVTTHYREGILYKEVENKPRLAAPFFEQAVSLWRGLPSDEQTRRHQERPKYIRSLYHLASCRLDEGKASQALALLEGLLDEDEGKNLMSPLFKHFAKGKCLYALGRHQEALVHLELAAATAGDEAHDFVRELAARAALAMNEPGRAFGYINRVPQRKRRPYESWTEADALVALGRGSEAIRVLEAAADRDRRGRHKALIRLSRIHLREGRLEKALGLAIEARDFCLGLYGNPSREAIFWEAAALFKLGRASEALGRVEELRRARFEYPHLGRLEARIRAAIKEGGHAGTAATAG